MSEGKARLTILIDAELEDALRAEQRCLAERMGLHASLSAVAAMAMRNGLMPPEPGEAGAETR